MSTATRVPQRGCVLPAWKFEAPRLAARLLPRPRLSDKIEQTLGKHRGSGDVFLLSAPPGYGKSVALAQWAAATTVPVAWFHLDPGDNDPVTFVTGFVRALRTRLPRARWSVEETLRRLPPGALTPVDLSRIVEVLVADIRRNAIKPLALVITNITDLAPEHGGHAVLDRLLARPPDQLRLALEVRDTPRLRLSPLLPQLRLEGMGADDLKLDATELDDLLALLGVTLSEQDAGQVRSLCDGWMTGVLLATGALQPGFLAPPAAGDLDRQAIFDYLASEVIERLPAELADFATAAAVLDYITPTLAAQLLDEPRARELLGQLDRRTGFVSRIGVRPEEPSYHIQPVLREALLLRLRNDGDHQEQALRRRAADLLEERGDVDAAARQYAAIAAHDELIALIERRGEGLLRSGRGATLLRWIEYLPDDARSTRPELRLQRAELLYQSGDIAGALEAAGAVWDVPHPLGTIDLSTAARALAARARAKFTLGQYESAAADALCGLEIVSPEEYTTIAKLRYMRAVCQVKLGDKEAALAALDEAAALAQRERDLWLLAHTHYVRSWIALTHNAFGEAERSAQAALFNAQEAGDEVGAVNSRLTLSAVHSHNGRYDTAREQLLAAAAQADGAGYRYGQAYASLNLADLALSMGDFSGAAAAYAEATRASEGICDAFLALRLAVGRAYALASTGQPERAIEQLAALSSGSALPADRLEVATCQAVALYHLAALDQATERIHEATQVAREQELTAPQAQAALVHAAILLARGDSTAARESLVEALAIAARHEGVATVLTMARMLPEVTPLLTQVNHPLAHELLTHLQTGAQGAISPTGASVAEAGGEGAIRVFSLGGARVFRGAERVTRWRLQAAEELLHFLLAQGGPVRKDTILEALWPHKDLDSANQLFRQACFHLNRVLGGGALAHEGPRWYLTVSCWEDSREFEALVAEGERLRAEGQTAAAAALLRKALTYWSGDYLEEVYNDWAQPRREQLYRRHMDCLEMLIDLETTLGQPEVAARLSYELLELDPARESAHRTLMIYFASRGELNAALKQYKRCARELRAETGQPPSPSTRALYQAIATRLQGAQRPPAGAQR